MESSRWLIVLNTESASENSQAADSLPPVHPPAGRFFVQLFLVPMVIVAMIVGVWFLVASLANRRVDPETLVTGIERLNADSWQKALALARELRDPRNEELRHDEELAGRLTELLDVQIDKASENRLAVWLCGALGWFQIDTGAQALARAASTERKPKDVVVRIAALSAIGTLMDQLPSEQAADQPEMLQAVLKGTEMKEEGGEEQVDRGLLRSTAAFVLGVFPQEEATERLVLLLQDPSLDVEFNAAIGLARRGDTRALPLLKIMLNPPDEALVDVRVKKEKRDSKANFEAKQRVRQQWKRNHIVENGLRAVAKMITNHPDVDVAELWPTIQSVSENKEYPVAVRSMAREVLRAGQPRPVEDAPVEPPKGQPETGSL